LTSGLIILTAITIALVAGCSNGTESADEPNARAETSPATLVTDIELIVADWGDDGAHEMIMKSLNSLHKGYHIVSGNGVRYYLQGPLTGEELVATLKNCVELDVHVFGHGMRVRTRGWIATGTSK